MPQRTLGRMAFAISGLALSAVLVAGCAGTSDAPASESAAGANAENEFFQALPAAVQEAGSVSVGTEAYYPPYEYIDTDGSTIVGLDIDLLDAVTERLGIDYKLENVAFDTLLPSLDAERYDVVVAGITDTVERQANYDFVDYFAADQAIIVTAGNEAGISSMADLCGLTVSVLVDSTQQSLLEEQNAAACASDPIDILTQQSDTEALMQVQSGRAAALLTQEAVGMYNASQIGGGTAFEVANEGSIEPMPLGYVFAKGNDELRDAFQKALQSLVDDGTYDEILSSYSLINAALDEITVNGAE
ncbi:ABC transporter substrate-binding protein [Microbacterium sp. NPDC058021]|uniref:ABC transporter substrate-binding protein n=1 Tax=Microbacterium sp. NPDC058021 TaxID=3346306 RepID=UPI0036D9501C